MRLKKPQGKLKRKYLRNLLSLTLIILVSGCETDPVTVNQFFYDGEKCFVRAYYYGADRIGALGESMEIPLEDCDGIVGYNFYEYQLVTDWANESRLRCVNKKN